MNENSYLDMLNKSPAPDRWSKYAINYGIGPAWLVDDPSFPRSIRRHKEIFINIRGDYWRNYKQMFNANNYEESIVLKFLHEIGHIIKDHLGNPDLIISHTGISEEFEEKVKQTPLNRILDDLPEKEAWDFALEIRANNPDQYLELLQAYRDWYTNYPNAVNWG